MLVADKILCLVKYHSIADWLLESYLTKHDLVLRVIFEY